MMLFAISGLALVLLASGIFFIHRSMARRFENALTSTQSRLRDEIKSFVENAGERFAHEQTKSKSAFEQNRQSVEHHVETLNKELFKISLLVQELEKNRSRQFGSIEEKLTQAALATHNLSEMTHQLSSVLGNNQSRGQLGEWVAEDILRYAGLKPEIHYRKNQSQETVATRPDYIFNLPDNHKVYMDVKFPWKNYLEYSKAADKPSQERYAKEFIRDVKNRLRELKKRDYINPAEQTLDYIILFIPSEQVFSSIHEMEPTITNEALEQKILLASPYTLYGILSIIRQAFDNFHFRESTNQILKSMKLFADDYENFKKRFGDLGELLGKTQGKYAEITDKSFKRLDQRLQNLDKSRDEQDPFLGQDVEQEKPGAYLAPIRERIGSHE